MNVLFVHYHDFRGNSAVHIANVANELESLGVSCTVAVPGRVRRSVALFPDRRFGAVSYRRARRRLTPAPDLIHAWTPREGLRRLVTDLASQLHVPYMVHLEDNEDVIAADQLGLPRDRIVDASEQAISRRLVASISHPRRYRELLGGSGGVTVIVERLVEFVPEGIPVHVLWPGYETSLFYPRPASPELRDKLDLGSARVVVYAGNVHPTNAGEVRELYRAVDMVDRPDRPVRLVRLGDDFLEFIGEDERRIEVRVPWQKRANVPSFYALGDVLAQPGAPDAFNNYRFPSKLPEYFAMGKPVILPRANAGLHANDGEECLLLANGGAAELAAKIDLVLNDDALSARLQAGARRFAEQRFSWARSAESSRPSTYGHSTAREQAAEAARLQPVLRSRRRGDSAAADPAVRRTGDGVRHHRHHRSAARSGARAGLRGSKRRDRDPRALHVVRPGAAPQARSQLLHLSGPGASTRARR